MFRNIPFLITLSVGFFFANLAVEETETKREPFQETLKMYERELKENPNNLQLLKALGHTHYQLQNYKRAAVLLREAHEQDPSDASVKLTLAYSDLYNNSDLAESEKLLQELDQSQASNAG